MPKYQDYLEYYDKFSGKTKYPNIFLSSYWGNFKFKEGDEKEDIFNNRNKFVEDYKIKKYSSLIWMENYKSFLSSKKYKSDHVELYQTKDNKFIILNSPYCPNEEQTEAFLLDGWIEINNLYSNNAKTFLKFITKKTLKDENKNFK